MNTTPVKRAARRAMARVSRYARREWRLEPTGAVPSFFDKAVVAIILLMVVGYLCAVVAYPSAR